jgi:hypothetical protein
MDNNLSFNTEAAIKNSENYLNIINFKKDQNKVDAFAGSIIGNLDKEPVRTLAFKFISICEKKKIKSQLVNILDRKLHAKDHVFQIAEHKTNFARWQKWGFNEEVFANFYESAKYLLESPLGNQMKIFHDPILLEEGQPGILVEGSWVSLEEIRKEFEIKFLPEFREKFMVHKNTGEVFTYLGNGRGLQKHNPYTVENLDHPITRLTETEFQETFAVAQKFLREGETESNPERTFIFQIVSSYVTNSCNNNAMEILYRKKHPWMRIVCGKNNPEVGIKRGDVYEIGFGWTAPSKLPAKTTKGRFRSEDLWNYNTSVKQRIVTNIPISQTEAQEMLKYAMEFHKSNLHPVEKDDKIAFNLWSQNCSAFVHYISKKAEGVNAPTKIYLTDLLQRISPDWLQYIGSKAKLVATTVKNDIKFASSFVPTVIRQPIEWAIKQIKMIGQSIASFVLSKPVEAVSIVIGGAAGEQGRAFTENANEKKVLGPRLAASENFFSLRRFFYHLPGILQEWQLKQLSTVIYKNPVKLTVVPPKPEQLREVTEKQGGYSFFRSVQNLIPRYFG